MTLMNSLLEIRKRSMVRFLQTLIQIIKKTREPNNPLKLITTLTIYKKFNLLKLIQEIKKAHLEVQRTSSTLKSRTCFKTQ